MKVRLIMLHSIPLITTITIALSLALIFGLIANKLKLPTIVGYLIAGILIGPFTPGIVANTQLASELAEIGVMLLMFGVGLHFSISQLLEMRKIALPGALIQIAVATILGVIAATSWGWGLASALIFGLGLSVASTVVLIRALESQGKLHTVNGQIAVGWLIVEDLAMVLVLVLLPPLATWIGGSAQPINQSSVWLNLLLTIVKVVSFIVLMLFMGKRLLPKLLMQIAKTGSRELFTLCVIAVAIGIAYIASKYFAMSFALGAFFAGLIMRESKYSERAAEESLPFREAFAVLFFVSVGMLFDPNIFLHEPLRILAVIAIIIVGKSIAAFLLVLAFRYPMSSAFTISASLAQIGEFSFILAALGLHLKLLPLEGQKLIIAGALVSIAINPFLFGLINAIQKRYQAKSKIISQYEHPTDPLLELPTITHKKYLSQQIVLVGFGRIGRRIAKDLTDSGIPFVVVDQNRELIEKIREQGFVAVCGEASDPSVLIQAHIARASMIVIALPDTFYVNQMIETARGLNPNIETAIRVNNEEEAALLKERVGGHFFYNEGELAKGISGYILKRFGINPQQ